MQKEFIWCISSRKMMFSEVENKGHILKTTFNFIIRDLIHAAKQIKAAQGKEIELYFDV